MANSIRQILKRESGFKISGTIRLEAGGERFFGPGPLELLERIAETGSISGAAKQMKMSYKKAWGIVHNLNSHSKQPIVFAQTGGEKGGGSIITTDAWKLIEYYRSVRKRFILFLERESRKLNS